MMLRPRQKTFVERALGALDTHGNTLGVAPTGSGKTICLSAVTGALLHDSDAKACILAHRDELTDQNRSKFARVNPGLTTSVVQRPGEILGRSGDVRHGADPVPGGPSPADADAWICW